MRRIDASIASSPALCEAMSDAHDDFFSLLSDVDFNARCDAAGEPATLRLLWGAALIEIARARGLSVTLAKPR